MNLADFVILIADDDRFIRDDVRDLLQPFGCRLVFAATAAETRQQAELHVPDLVVLDLKFPDCQDLSLLQFLRGLPRAPEVVILSSQTENIKQVVDAIKMGAHDFVPKPFVGEELANRIAKALDLRRLRFNQDHLLEESRASNGIERMTGECAAMKQVRTMLQKLADIETSVLLLGECGTGKELAARALHDLSKRRALPFVAVNCASIPESLVESVFFGHKRGAFTGALENNRGKFEAAANGTIFLDEIGDMPLPQQAALLRVLEYKKFTPLGGNQELECRARVILATNRDLKTRVREGKFREDLYFRIMVTPVTLPPLRARGEDIPILCEAILQRLTANAGQKPFRVNATVLELFQQYDWPGNVRELRNVLEAAVILRDEVQDELMPINLPLEMQLQKPPPTVGNALALGDQHEKEALLDALKQAGGNQSQAAKILGCHRNTVRARIRYYGLPE